MVAASVDVAEAVKQSFKLIDEQRGGNGTITVEELGRVLRSLRHTKDLGDADIAALVTAIGNCNDGIVDFKCLIDWLYGLDKNESEFLSFPAVEDLKLCLNAAGVDVSAWGKGKAKSLQNLFSEIADGSSYLMRERKDDESNRLVRIVEQVYLEVCFEDKILVESFQVLPTGQRRERNRLPGDRRQPSDRDHRHTAVRFLAEALNIKAQAQDEPRLSGRCSWPPGVAQQPELYQRIAMDKKMDMYPNLACRYVYHHLSLSFALGDCAQTQAVFASCGLPECANFVTEEAAETGGVLQRHWMWMDAAKARTGDVRGYPGRL
eukprot:TRINITY_DN7043_c0_g2_i1.p1 TRINITY_DN7043_c0_g2~~TRINITY_DN7043_c0_g2_i1.p1  ORF type:complete len:320 (+),score=49.33 TRINITY_DN7043_c0_g2_i1:135-1094(+)